MIKVQNNKKELDEVLHTAQLEGIAAVYKKAVNNSVTDSELRLMGTEAMRRIVAFAIWRYNMQGEDIHCLQVRKSHKRRADLRAFIMQLCGFSSRTTLRKIIKKGSHEQEG